MPFARNQRWPAIAPQLVIINANTRAPNTPTVDHNITTPLPFRASVYLGFAATLPRACLSTAIDNSLEETNFEHDTHDHHAVLGARLLGAPHLCRWQDTPPTYRVWAGHEATARQTPVHCAFTCPRCNTATCESSLFNHNATLEHTTLPYIVKAGIPRL